MNINVWSQPSLPWDIKPEKPSTPDKLKTYVAIILDKSGSMDSVRDVTISGFNEQVQTLKKNAKGSGEWYLSFVTFNENVDVVLWNQPVASVQEATRQTYQPNGMTAMYDAVGYTIDRLLRETNPNDPNVSYLLIVMSDGLENASKTWSQNNLAEMIQSLQKTEKWTITYMGANQDLSKIQKDLNLNHGHTMSYTSTLSGTAKAFSAMSTATASYAVARATGASTVDAFYNNSEDKDES